MGVNNLDESVVPKGVYCYTPKEFPCEENGWVYKINACPYWKVVQDEGIDVVHCELCASGGLMNDMTDAEFKILVEKYGNEDVVFDTYPSSLLWDMVKDCGVNYPDEEEDYA
jgi:hypothetical protein